MNLFSILLFALLGMTVNGCEPQPSDVGSDLLEVAPERLSVDYRAQSATVEVRSTSDFRLGACDALWCNAEREQLSVDGGTVCYRLHLSVQANPDSLSREAHVALRCGALSKRITLVQGGVVGVSDTVPSEPEPEPVVSDAVDFAMLLAPGWNLGNNLDAANNGVASETAWGNGRCTEQTMERVKAAGFRSVRIPVSYIGHIGAAPDYTIEEAWLNRVAEVVGYARKAGLKVIINIHHDGNPDVAKQNYWLDILRASEDASVNEQVKRELSALWTQIADRFADAGADWLIFEGMNEINDGHGGYPFVGNKDKIVATLNGWNQAFVDAVRSRGGENSSRYLAVTSFYARADLAVNGLVLPTDAAENRLLVAVHSYDPWDYAGAGKVDDWGHTGTHFPVGEEEMRSRLKGLYDRFVSKGIPVYMGEFGCVNRATERATAFQRYYTEYYAKAAADYRIPFILWDNGVSGKTGDDAFGFLNHSTGEYINHSKPLLDALVRAQTDTTAAYTLQAVYQTAPK